MTSSCNSIRSIVDCFEGSSKANEDMDSWVGCVDGIGLPMLLSNTINVSLGNRVGVVILIGG